MTPFLSLCMIVRDEEKVLERCLKSVANLVDEIIVVDTGSKDSTKEIAYAHGAIVYDYEWNSHFADARNYAVSKAAGKWVLYLDADEYFDTDNLSELRSYLTSLDETKPTGIILPIYNFVDEEQQNKISESKSMRLFSRHPDLTFVRPIHEQLISKSGSLIERNNDLPIYHSGYTTESIKLKNKFERNNAILSQMKAEGQWTPYDSFVMGNEHFAQDRYKEALDCYIEADSPTERNKSWLPLCLVGEINCRMKLDQYSEAYKTIRRGQSLWPKASDFYWFEGYLLSQLGLNQEALTALQTGINLSSDSRNPTPYLVSPNYATTLPLQLASTLYLKQFQEREAVSCLTKLCYANPNHFGGLHSLLQILVRTESLEQIETFLHSLYSEPQEHQRVMLLDAAVRLGQAELSERYWQQLSQLKITVPAIIRVQFALLHNHWVLAEAALQTDLPASPNLEWNLVLHRARMQWPERLEVQFKELEFDSLDTKSVANIAMQLFREGKYEIYDEWLNQNSDRFAEMANLIGNDLFQDKQFEISLDYYSLLLQRQELQSTGYENLFRLYIGQGDLEEALEFLEQAIILSPERPDLYVNYLVNSKDPSKCEAIRQKLNEQFIGMRDFPLDKIIIYRSIANKN